MKRTTKDEIRQAEKNGEAAKHRHRGRMNLVSVEASNGKLWGVPPREQSQVRRIYFLTPEDSQWTAARPLWIRGRSSRP